MGNPLPLRLYNTLTRRLEPLCPAQEGHVRIYCCGPTTYDVSHAGHGRTAMLPDLLVRHLRASGVRVTYVRNITDVDDKILKRAKELGQEPLHLSERFAVMYQEDVAALGCVQPEHEPKVSQVIPDIIAFIEKLVHRGVAYELDTLSGKDVWYSVRSFSSYGKLSRRNLDELRTGEGLEERGKSAHTEKRDPLDFALWKSTPQSEWGFASPWGHGRPGWHTECCVMCERYLGFGFDVHAGGMDLIFPHHENEIAQSEAMHPDNGPFAQMWLHGGFLTVDKEKMAKSLGNFVTMRDCYARNDPEALRYFCLSAHYRGPVEFETATLQSGQVIFPSLDEAEKRIDYLYSTVQRLAQLAAEPKSDAHPHRKELAALAGVIRSTRRKVADALNDDLNAPVALAAIHDFAKTANDLCDLVQKRKKDSALVAAAAILATEAIEAFRSSADVLGILQTTPAAYRERTRARRLSVRGLDEQTIANKVSERQAARATKEFAKSDAIRKELDTLGIELADSPSGTTWWVSVSTPRTTA